MEKQAEVKKEHKGLTTALLIFITLGVVGALADIYTIVIAHIGWWIPTMMFLTAVLFTMVIVLDRQWILKLKEGKKK